MWLGCYLNARLFIKQHCVAYAVVLMWLVDYYLVIMLLDC